MGDGIQFNHIWAFSHLCLDFKTNGRNGNSSYQRMVWQKKNKKMCFEIRFMHSKKKKSTKRIHKYHSIELCSAHFLLHISTPLTSSTTPLHELI